MPVPLVSRAEHKPLTPAPSNTQSVFGMEGRLQGEACRQVFQETRQARGIFRREHGKFACVHAVRAACLPEIDLSMKGKNGI
jgi:hypothetical protein